MIDTHVHLDDEKFNDDQFEVIKRASESGVKKMINIGAGLGSSRRSVELAQKYADIFAAVGLHPHYFNEYGERSFDRIEEFRELSRQEKVVAIGEVGLDYFSHTGDPVSEEQKENQKTGFVMQIELAKELALPIIIHCRDAYEDVYEIIKKYSEISFVFHCYGGNLEFTRKLLQLANVEFSLTGNITYAKAGAEAINVIKEIPMEKIMLETDCPYLAPVPHRGKRNEPSFVTYVAEKIAEIKGFSAKEVDEISTKNTNKFFKLS